MPAMSPRVTDPVRRCPSSMSILSLAEALSRASLALGGRKRHQPKPGTCSHRQLDAAGTWLTYDVNHLWHPSRSLPAARRALAVRPRLATPCPVMRAKTRQRSQRPALQGISSSIPESSRCMRLFRTLSGRLYCAKPTHFVLSLIHPWPRPVRSVVRAYHAQL